MTIDPTTRATIAKAIELVDSQEAIALLRSLLTAPAAAEPVEAAAEGGAETETKIDGRRIEIIEGIPHWIGDGWREPLSYHTRRAWELGCALASRPAAPVTEQSAAERARDPLAGIAERLERDAPPLPLWLRGCPAAGEREQATAELIAASVEYSAAQDAFLERGKTRGISQLRPEEARMSTAHGRWKRAIEPFVASPAAASSDSTEETDYDRFKREHPESLREAELEIAASEALARLEERVRALKYEAPEANLGGFAHNGTIDAVLVLIAEERGR